jgi:hypothetical protein
MLLSVYSTRASSIEELLSHLRHFKHPHSTNNILAMKNTADVGGGKPIAICSQSMTGVSAVYPLVTFNDIYGRKGEVLFF